MIKKVIKISPRSSLIYKYLSMVEVRVDFLLLSAIMIINHIIVHLKETRATIRKVQVLIQENPLKGFWLTSFVAFAASPFLTDDVSICLNGICLRNRRRELFQIPACSDPPFLDLRLVTLKT